MSDLRHAYIGWNELVAQLKDEEFNEEDAVEMFEQAIARIREDVLLELEDHLLECALDYDDEDRYRSAMTEVKKFRLILEEKV